MKTIEEKLNEMEQRHTAEIKALREELGQAKEADERILGGMFRIDSIDGSWWLTDVHTDSLEIDPKQIKQIKAIEDILKAAKLGSILGVQDSITKAEELGLKF